MMSLIQRGYERSIYFIQSPQTRRFQKLTVRMLSQRCTRERLARHFAVRTAPAEHDQRRDSEQIELQVNYSGR